MARKKSSTTLSRGEEIQLKRRARRYRRNIAAIVYVGMIAIAFFVLSLAKGTIMNILEQTRLSYSFIYQYSASVIEEWMEVANYTINKVEIKGIDKITKEEIYAKIYTQNGKRYKKFPYSLMQMQTNIKEIPLVKNVTVSRSFSDSKIEITIQERKIIGVALSPIEKTHLLIDEGGLTFSGEEYCDRLHNLVKVKNLTYYSDYPPLYRYLAMKRILGEVVQVERISDRRWNIKLKNGLLVKLPAKDWQRAIETLLELQPKLQVFSPTNKMIYLDLRIPGKIFLR